MSILTETDRATADRVWRALGNRQLVLDLFDSTSLRHIAVHGEPEYALVTVATLEDLTAWREELGGRVEYADGPEGFRTAVLTSRTPVCGESNCSCRAVEVRVAVMYPAGAEDENWHEQYAGIGVAA